MCSHAHRIFPVNIIYLFKIQVYNYLNISFETLCSRCVRRRPINASP